MEVKETTGVEEKKSLNFIEQKIENDLAEGKNGGKIQTRIPPEPNGYLHIGSAKAIWINWGTARKYGGQFNLRYDDTNPAKEDDEYVSGDGDDTSFALDDLSGFKISHEIADRGHEYYMENRVRYISIDGTKGYAIVEGTEGYEVEFTYDNGQISHLICSCFCSYNCKHEFAVLLQLRETLDLIEKNYASEYAESGYFAAICKGTLFKYAIDGKEAGYIEI